MRSRFHHVCLRNVNPILVPHLNNRIHFYSLHSNFKPIKSSFHRKIITATWLKASAVCVCESVYQNREHETLSASIFVAAFSTLCFVKVILTIATNAVAKWLPFSFLFTHTHRNGRHRCTTINEVNWTLCRNWFKYFSKEKNYSLRCARTKGLI